MILIGWKIIIPSLIANLIFSQVGVCDVFDLISFDFPNVKLTPNSPKLNAILIVKTYVVYWRRVK